MLKTQQYSDNMTVLKLSLRIVLLLGTIVHLVLEMVILPSEVLTIGKTTQYHFTFCTILIIIQIALKLIDMIMNITVSIEYNNMFANILVVRVIGYSINGAMLVAACVSTLLIWIKLKPLEGVFMQAIMNYLILNLGLVLLNSLVAVGLLLLYEIPTKNKFARVVYKH